MIIQDFLVKRRWIILTFSFAAVTLATSAYLIYREVYRPKPPNAILSKYGYLFRQKKDMAILNQLIQSQTALPVKVTDEPTTDTCHLSCSDKTMGQQNHHDVSNEGNTTEGQWFSNHTQAGHDEYIVNYREPQAEALRDQPQIKYVYHGCCRSRQQYMSPPKLKAHTTKKMVHIVQFRDKGQFFLTDHCKHEKDCDRGCQCRQQLVTAVALVVDFYPKHTNVNEDVYNDYVERNARIEL
ncbi:unnamed protein product, partial [Candidula unifasciata]